MNATTSLTASGVIKGASGALLGIVLTGAADAASVTIYDNATTNSGPILAVLKAAINTTVVWTAPAGGQAAASGLYATITGTTPNLSVVYR